MNKSLSKRLDSLEQEQGSRADLEREYEAYCAGASARLKAKLDQTHERLVAANGGKPLPPFTPEEEAYFRQQMQALKEELARDAGKTREWFLNGKKHKATPRYAGT